MTIQRVAAAAAMILVISACQSHQQGAPGTADSRSVQIFNGQDLTGWTPYLGSPGEAAKVWSVKDGVLACSGNPVGYIRTTQRYRNFQLELDWRFDPARGAGNSGVLLRLVGEDQVWPKSIEAQLHSENAGDIWNIGEFPMQADPARTQGRRTVKLHPTNERPLGEWNHYSIRLDGGKLELRVNGLLQNSATHCEVVDGFIGLQSEGAYIEFRNITLTPL